MLEQTVSESEPSEKDVDIPLWMYDESSATSNGLNSKSKWSITNELVFTDKTVVRRVYLLARIMDKCLKQAGICYWTSGGTSLGCVRHQGLIPWDDDLDLCVYQKDLGEVKDHFKTLLHHNECELVENSAFGYRVFHKTDSESLPSQYQTHRYPFCDIFVMKRKARTCVIASSCGRTLWPEEYYFHEDIAEMQEKLFGDVYLSCPGNIEEYFLRTYGEKWFSQGATHNYDHVNQCFVKSVKFDLEQHHYQPARPFG